MRTSWHIGRVFGVDIAIDWSWLVIFALMTWNLTAAFTQWHPQWAPSASLGIAILASLLFFLSVVAHELSHSLVARRFGIPVRNITLFLLGGVSNIEKEPPSPRAEFLMAIVGPLTSLVLGAAFLALGALATGDVSGAGYEQSSSDPFEHVARLGPSATLLMWLGPVNILVGVFNLIPAFPLDGGRVLRAALWAGTKSLRKATLWASWVGRMVGWAFIGIGILSILSGGGVLGGVWIAVIGTFLSAAAARSSAKVLIDDALGDLPVARLMRTETAGIPEGTTIAHAVENWFMRSEGHRFPVSRGGAMVGVVGVADLLKVDEAAWPSTDVAAIMTPAANVSVCAPEDRVVDALSTMARLGVDELPVVHDGQLVGLLEHRDITRWIDIRKGRTLVPRRA